MNSDKISSNSDRIVVRILSRKVRMVRSLGDRTFQPRFSRLLKIGLQRGDVSVKIATVNSPGCWVFQKRLMNTSVEVPARVEKLQVFYTAEDLEGQIAWNNGVVFRDKSSKEIETLLRDLDAAHVWTRIVQLYDDTPYHRYRDLSGLYDRG